MNKYALFMVLVFFLVLFTIIAGSIDSSTSSNILITDFGDLSGSNFFANVLSYLGIFFRILTFQVNGIPAIFNILIFYPLTAGTIFMLIDIIRGNG